MEKTIYMMIRELTERLNRCRDEYYNQNAPSVTDEVYDRLFDELAGMEKEAGIRMANSPTQTVGYPAVGKLEKTAHAIPLLSLDKTKRSEDLAAFMAGQQILLMLKLDGLTTKLTYENGQLVQAATRGDGDEGEVITHNARGIGGIPMEIPFRERLVVTGEALIRPSDFKKLQETLTDANGERYKNGRNLAAGSVRLLDAAVCRERRVRFLAFHVLEGFPELSAKADKLRRLPALGFEVCKFIVSSRNLAKEEIEGGIASLKQYAEASDVPIDGIVMTYNDIAYAKACGRTGHHYKDGIAFKFEDDLFETVMRSIEWTPTRSGEIAPVAVFDTVEIDGCAVSRASLHNLSFIEGLELTPGCRVLVSKRNQIIPHIEDNLQRGGFSMESVIPHECPCCGEPTRIHTTRSVVEGKERITKTLFCDNPLCETRRLRQFVHFVSKKAMDIDGLAEAALEKFIGRGWLHSFMDIYRLDKHRAEIVRMDGFGEKSWQRLWEAIEHSRSTTFERYLIAMDIPMIGNTASKTLCRYFDGSLDAFEDAVNRRFDFSQLPDFGATLRENIDQWFNGSEGEENRYVWEELQKMMIIQNTAPVPDAGQQDNPFSGLTIVVTGKVEPYTRDGINAKIESLGAHAGSSVSKKTNYLVCGENAGSKLDKARELGVTVLLPAEFFRMAGE